MFAYWTVVLIPIMLALGESARRRGARVLMLSLLFVGLLLFMGLRETGGDYTTYVRLFELLQLQDIKVAVATVEPIYGFLNWASAQLEFGLYGVNLACALVFLYCLFRAARKEELPILLVALAIPYFVIVVGVGYTRQGVAAALILLGVVQLREGNLLRSSLSMVLAAGFHFSAFAALALPLFASTRHQTGVLWFLSRAFLVAIMVASSQTLLSDRLDAYAEHYLESDRYQSGGAFLRSVVSAAAGLVFFVFARQFKRRYDDYSIWRPFALLALLSAPLSLVASTPVDRLGLYLLPFQVITFARLPLALNRGRSLKLVRMLVLAGYVLYFFVWLHLGTYSNQLWVPYRWIFS